VIRERTGLTQTQVAADAEIDRANYVHMEAGRRPGTAPQIKALADVLCVPVTALLGPEPQATNELAEAVV
jgi:transcriptional regulator with XRE-family HTH domain